MIKIEQLEIELNQEINELNEYLLRETLKSSMDAMEEIDRQLKVIDVFLEYSNDVY